MRKFQRSIIIFSFFVAVLVKAQDQKTNYFNPAELVQPPQGFLHKLIDPNKFSMSQSYSLSILSTGRRAFNQGLYLNTMSYQFSDPLMVQLRFGYLHQPLGQFGNQTGQSNAQAFVQGARLQYKPSNNMMLTLDYQVYPSGLQSPYYYGYGYTSRSRFLGD